MAEGEVSMGHVMKGLTMELVITGLRRARIRTWLGTRLMALGARVVGCDVEVSIEPTNNEVIRYQPIDGGPEQVVHGRRIRAAA